MINLKVEQTMKTLDARMKSHRDQFQQNFRQIGPEKTTSEQTATLPNTLKNVLSVTREEKDFYILKKKTKVRSEAAEEQRIIELLKRLQREGVLSNDTMRNNHIDLGSLLIVNTPKSLIQPEKTPDEQRIREVINFGSIPS